MKKIMTYLVVCIVSMLVGGVLGRLVFSSRANLCTILCEEEQHESWDIGALRRYEQPYIELNFTPKGIPLVCMEKQGK